MSVREEAHEHELEDVALADHRALDLVEDCVRSAKRRIEHCVRHEASSSSKSSDHPASVEGSSARIDTGAPADCSASRSWI